MPTERALVSAISLRHIIWLPHESLKAHFGLPWVYASGTIAVTVTWIERGFNACQTNYSMYPSIVNRLRAIATYWSEIATFPTPLHLTPELGVFPLEFREKVLTSEN